MRLTTLLFAMSSMLAILAPAHAGNEGAGIFKEVIYDLNEDLYFPGSPQILADLGIGPARLIEIQWEDVVLETFDNVGVPNWGNEAWFGIAAVTGKGNPLAVLLQPFPDAFEGGTFGPTSGTLDVSLLELFSSSTGEIQFLVASGWDDGSGMPSGVFHSGQLILRYEPLIPAPASLAIFGCLALGGRRRRRG
jgi:hypothetical protein